MSLKSDFIRIFKSSFKTSPRWSDWFFTDVYRDEDVVSLTIDDHTASVLMLSPTTMAFHGIDLPASYVSCVATATAERGKGYMSKLMTEAIDRMHAKGDAFALLIPDGKRLYFFYDRFGFATTFYVDEQRYTSVHAFATSDDYVPAEPTYAMFSRLEAMRANGVRHTRTDFNNIMRDIELDKGIVLAISDASGDSAAMAFVNIYDNAVVKALLATDDVAAEAVLALVRSEVGEKSVVVNAQPDDRACGLRARGMARIINAPMVLGALAEAFPKMTMTIRLHDDLIADNNATYQIKNGACGVVDNYEGRPDLDVHVSVLAALLFSAPSIASIFSLPSARPTLDLMLD